SRPYRIAVFLQDFAYRIGVSGEIVEFADFACRIGVSGEIVEFADFACRMGVSREMVQFSGWCKYPFSCSNFFLNSLSFAGTLAMRYTT
ncbi:MAG: hypothetical protein E6230_28755, partial [Paenibacillus dendritiformis]|nr:hypothetical protein [Paenibacillus dendritiformis]